MIKTYSIHTVTDGIGDRTRHRVRIRIGTTGNLLGAKTFGYHQDQSEAARTAWIAERLAALKAFGTLAPDAREVFPVNGGKRNGAGRKPDADAPRTIPVQVRFSESEIADLDAQAARTGKKRSALVRDLTLAGLVR